MTKFSTFLSASALSAALAFGQRPGPGRPGGEPPDPAKFIEMRVNRLAERLSLTDDQKARAMTIFTEAQAAGENARTGGRTTRESLSQAIKSNDTGAIDRLAATLGTVSGQLTAIESKAEASFYSILTADQKAKYDSMRGGPGGRMGPGGPGGPGGFEGRRRF